jgi:hypothetical protein
MKKTRGLPRAPLQSMSVDHVSFTQPNKVGAYSSVSVVHVGLICSLQHQTAVLFSKSFLGTSHFHIYDSISLDSS